MPSKCVKCGRTVYIVTVELDKTTRKKWSVTRCAGCDHPTDIEPYAGSAIKKTSPKLLKPPLWDSNDKSFIGPFND